MILLQWHTGMRPNEVVQIRTVDVDRTPHWTVWIYSSRRHQNARIPISATVHIERRGRVLLHRVTRRPCDGDTRSTPARHGKVC